MAYLRLSIDRGTAIIHNQVAYKKSSGQPSLGVIDTNWGASDTSWSSQSFLSAEPGGRTSWTDQQMAVANLDIHYYSTPDVVSDLTTRQLYVAPTSGTIRFWMPRWDGSWESGGYHLYVNGVLHSSYPSGNFGSIDRSIPANISTGDIVSAKRTHAEAGWRAYLRTMFLPHTYPY